MNGVNVLRIVRVPFELLPQARDGVVHRSSVGKFRKSPNLAKQLISVHDAVLTFGQIVKQLEFAVGQVNRPDAIARIHYAKIYAYGSKHELFHQRSRAPEDGSDASDQFLKIEGLRNIVICADIQSSQAVALLPTSGQHNNWRLAWLSQQSKPFEAVPAWKHHVQDDQVRTQAPDNLKRGVAIGSQRDLEPLERQVVLEHLGERFVVVNNQDSCFLSHKSPAGG
jgi:hypothetical protein